MHAAEPEAQCRQVRDAAWMFVFARVLLACLPISLVVDSANGYLIWVGSAAPLSATFKLAFLAGLLGYLALTKLEHFFVAVSSIAIVIALTLLHAIRGSDVEGAILDLQWGLRCVLIFVAYLAFGEMLKSGHLRSWHVASAFAACLAVIVANLVVGMFGYGFAQYDEKFGTAGFFFAGNELAVCIVSLAAVLFMFTFAARGVTAYLGIVLVFMAAAALTLTKVAIFGVMLLAVLLPVLQTLAVGLVRGRLDRKGLRFSAVAVFFAAVGLALTVWFVVWLGFVDRGAFFLQRAGWVGLILSGRDVMIQSAWSQFAAGADLLDLLLGSGVWWLQGRHGGQTESDLVDFAIAFGLPATCLVVLVVLGVAAAAAGSLRKSARFYPFSAMVVFLGAFFIAISAVAGHVFNSGMAAPFIGISLAMWRSPVITDSRGALVRYAR